MCWHRDPLRRPTFGRILEILHVIGHELISIHTQDGGGKKSKPSKVLLTQSTWFWFLALERGNIVSLKITIMCDAMMRLVNSCAIFQLSPLVAMYSPTNCSNLRDSSWTAWSRQVVHYTLYELRYLDTGVMTLSAIALSTGVVPHSLTSSSILFSSAYWGCSICLAFIPRRSWLPFPLFGRTFIWGVAKA